MEKGEKDMIYVTGDTHRAFERIEEFCRKNKTTKEDVLVILGDAGINYYQNLRDEDLKMELDHLPITLFCIQGNHEKRASSIGTYEDMRWHGGIVYVEPKHPSILFAKDGEIFDLNGKKTIIIGGAYSIDKFYRVIRGWQWFPDEQPSAEIKEYVEAQLEAVHWKIDYVFSHTAPLKYEPTEVFIPGIDQSRVDKSTEEWLDKLEDKLTYEKWFCGHYHTEKKIDRLQFMFEDYVKL